MYGSGPVDQPVQVTLSLLHDSSGEGPAAGATVELVFAPPDDARFLALSDSGTLSYDGTWSIQSDQLTVDFAAPDFTRHGTFAMSYTTAPLTIPFQVFTGESGTSTWSVAPTDPVAGALDLADAAAATADGVTPSDYVSAAADYVAAVTGVPVVDRTTAVSSGADAAPVSLNTAPAGDVQLADQCVPTISQIIEFTDAIRLQMACGSTVVIPMLSPGGGVAGATGDLSPGPFSTIPLVDNNPARPGTGIDDPPNKRALLFEPFAGVRTFVLQPTGKGTVTLTVGGFANENVNAVNALVADGYDVHSPSPLLKDSATVANLISAVSGRTPGVLYIDSHGDSQGDLLTGDFLGVDLKSANAALAKVAAQNGIPPADLGQGYVDVQGMHAAGGAATPRGAFQRAYMLVLKPAFWTWLRTAHGADFSRSLVYVAACDTDQSDALRNAIGARAYFAFRTPVSPALTLAVGQYLTGLLLKPSFTSEEAYYNMLRIDAQRTTVYSDDNDFKGILDAGGVDSRSSDPTVTEAGIVNVLDAYGSRDGTMVPYTGNGWLTSGLDEGQIFYLLTAARAGSDEDTKQGLSNLKGCWDTWWSIGTLPGIASPYCQKWNDGSAPSQDEYDYALYLLTGQKHAFSGTPVPRFTLNDGG